jgi:hypothetical protein
MKKRWRLVLPIFGVLLFATATLFELRFNRDLNSHRYFWWSGIRLDRDPSSRHPLAYWYPSCQSAANCEGWEPAAVWVDPGFLVVALFISGAPAFAAGGMLVRGLGKLGFNEVVTFFSIVPILLGGWYFLLGLFFDWLGYRWRQRPKDLPTT